MSEKDFLIHSSFGERRPEEVGVSPVSEAAISEIAESRKQGRLEIMYEGHPVVLGIPLGSGGSKEVYSVYIEDQAYALAIPAAGIDIPSIVKDKWGVVLAEPEATERVRGLGLYTNDLVRRIPITINGTQFPGLLMHRFEDLPFEVRDAKNRGVNNESNTVLIDAVQAGTSSSLLHIAKELAVLINNGVKLQEDSFSISIVNEEVHLYFHDLGTARFEPIAEERRDAYIHGYTSFASHALVESLTASEYAIAEKRLDRVRLEKDLELMVVKMLTNT